MDLVNDFGISKIVAHIAFKFFSVASGTFPTASTGTLTVLDSGFLSSPYPRFLIHLKGRTRQAEDFQGSGDTVFSTFGRKTLRFEFEQLVLGGNF